MSLNLAECIDMSAMAAPDKTALVFDDFQMSYASLSAAAMRVANALKALGIRPGDKVGLLLPNTPQFPMVYYGILYAGAIAVPMNVLLRRREIAFRLQDLGARALFVHEQLISEAAIAFDQSETCEHLIVVEAGVTPASPATGHSFLKLLGQADAHCELSPTNPDDVAVIIYGSAIDGRSRGAQLTHFNLFQNALTIKEYALGYYPSDVCLTVLPLFHGFGQTTMMNAPFLAQSTVTLISHFEPHKVFEVIQRDRATLLALVPTMFLFMVHYKKSHEFDLTSLRVAITGGSAMPPDLASKFTELFNVPVLEGYGLTETSPVVCWNPSAAKNRPGSIGLPIWGVRMAVERADGTRADVGEEGEIVIRGHNVMKGYLNLPDVDAQVFRGGWFHTGDLGYVDAEGYYFFTGLKKEMINRAGMNVFPKEVEKLLLEHPAITDAAVVGLPDPVRGEEVMAYVVLRAGQVLSAKEVTEYCREHLAAYKTPRKVEFVEVIPRLADGRADKARLRQGG